MNAARLLVVFDLPGHHLVAAVVDLHVAAHDHLLGVLVVDKLIGGQKQLGIFRHVRTQRIKAFRSLLRERGRTHSHGKCLQRHACEQGSVDQLCTFAVACRH
ncbi:hypothetical protein D3C78_1624630 [compost metagenome]